jgi:hypothetical protein
MRWRGRGARQRGLVRAPAKLDNQQEIDGRRLEAVGCHMCLLAAVYCDGRAAYRDRQLVLPRKFFNQHYVDIAESYSLATAGLVLH